MHVCMCGSTDPIDPATVCHEARSPRYVPNANTLQKFFEHTYSSMGLSFQGRAWGRRQTKLRYLYIWFTILAVCLMCARLHLRSSRVIQETASSSISITYPSAKTNISIVLVSSPIPGFEENLSWMIRLTLQSALQSFRLPDDDVTLDLLVFFPCHSNFHHPAQPYSVKLVQDGFEPYTRSVFLGIDTITEAFSSISFYCAGLFSTAICHIAGQSRLSHSAYFVIEHDWVIFPTQVNLSGRAIAEFVSHNDHDISYVLLQRGDRSVTMNKPLFREHSVLLFRAKQYSNNPFISTGKFLADLTLNSGLCTDLTSGHWERRAEKYAIESGLSKRISLLVPSNKTNRANLYHIDGKLLFFAQKFNTGALFEAGTLAQMTLDQADVVHNLERFCQKLPDHCSPYYLREVMLDRVLNYAKSLPCVDNSTTLPHFASAFLKAHGIDSVDLEGTFPGRDKVEGEMRRRRCRG